MNIQQWSDTEFLNRVIHEKVLGKTLDGPIPDYCKDDRWVTAIMEKFFYVEVSYLSIFKEKYEVTIRPSGNQMTQVKGSGTTLPEAVCRAAWMAIEAQDN